MERAYLLHESARNDLFNDSLDYCKQFAASAEAEAMAADSHIYTFLAVVMQLKAEIMASNIERQAEHLTRLRELVQPLQSEHLERLVACGAKVRFLVDARR